ncbi:MAG: acetoacetate decarboxylase family protein [Candidatus Helarchaeota archaeon]
MGKLVSMPVSASLYPEPPYYYRNAEIVTVVYSIGRDAVSEIVPPPLKTVKSPMVMAFIGWYPETTIGPYHEAATFIQAYYKPEEGKRIEGFYCNSMFVDSDIAMAAGREIWGYPKKLAHMEVKKEGNKVIAILNRKNIEVVRIVCEPKTVLRQVPDANTITLKQVFQPDGSGLEIRELIITTLKMESINTHAGPTSIEFQESEEDPLYLLQPKALMQGFYGIVNLVLPYGNVIWRAT